jgi:fructokinase
MRKIIAIGESVLDTLFSDGQPVKSFVGGRIANAAASLGSLNFPVTMVSECCTDTVGDIIVDFFKNHNVDVNSVDRFTDGSTAFSAIFNDAADGSHIINYGTYPDDRFDVVWPRIDENDIVIFGSLYAIDVPQRDRLFELVSYAVERKAIVIYLPGFQHGINFRITKVMPAILENLEIANMVIAHESDINAIFPGEDAAKAFRNHIEFYCSTYFHINPDLSVSLFTTGKRQDVEKDKVPSNNLLGWQAGFVAGIIFRLLKDGVTHEMLTGIDDEQWQSVIDTAYEFANMCATSKDNCISADFAAKKIAEYNEAEANRAN